MPVNDPVLTLPESPSLALSIRAKAMLFHDPISQALLQQVERVARSEATVVVIGETGTGKELIARHVHTASGRRGPFVAVNCGAFTESLIDAELFGHEAGAFTGAQGARAGWFETAHGGTLFLDEIGDLSPPLQVKLLRVLQERQVVRLGSRRPIPVDVRLVAATNIDLQKAVEAQHFRADLYYRLNVASVNLPPLRERPGDILPLAHHFAGVYAARMGQREVFIAPDAEAALLAYVWPGNIRELENVMHFALIVCRNGVVRADDLKLVAQAVAESLTHVLVADARGLARQVARHNVTINNVLPGVFDTDAQKNHILGMLAGSGKTYEQLWEARGRSNPAERYGRAEEAGAFCAFLCSVHAGYITGQSLLIDGGGYPGTF